MLQSIESCGILALLMHARLRLRSFVLAPVFGLSLLLGLWAAPGCEKGAADSTAAGDPDLDSRCASLCKPSMPKLDGAYAICSQESIAECKQACTERIHDTKVVCSDCLLKDACFDPYCGQKISGTCGSSGCWVSSAKGSCEYDTGKPDSKTEADCIHELYPRETVECTPKYADSSPCVAACASSAGG